MRLVSFASVLMMMVVAIVSSNLRAAAAEVVVPGPSAQGAESAESAVGDASVAVVAGAAREPSAVDVDVAAVVSGFNLARYREFIRKADWVNRVEPKLVYNPRFYQAQKLTLRYQGFAQGRLAQPFYRVFLRPAKNVQLSQVSDVFFQLSREASSLSQSLLPHVESHVALIEDLQYKKSYVARYNQILSSIFPRPDGALSDYKVFDCDYTSQPTNALWFMVNALIILDDYADVLFGEEWAVERRRILSTEGLLDVEQIRRIVSPGLVLSWDRRTLSWGR